MADYLEIWPQLNIAQRTFAFLAEPAAGVEEQVVAEEDLSALGPFLLSMPEAERVTVIGFLTLAKQLEQILPLTMTVSHLDPDAAFRLILAAMGVSEPVLNQIDAWGDEELFAAFRSA
ncbi:MAG: hypothetical protein HYZ88_00815 [Candidatus Omnitrophica bacterium]|nr:hypothetical protein [Candidatus Omnitrophota bacterium]